MALGSVCPGQALSLGLLRSLWGFSHVVESFVVRVLRNIERVNCYFKTTWAVLPTRWFPVPPTFEHGTVMRKALVY